MPPLATRPYPAGSVSVSTPRQRAKAGKKAKLTVHNTGSYIPPEDLQHVFERFYRADKSRTEGDSSGLGLAIVESVVEAMGGTVAAESSETGGTAFTALLPRENG